MPSTAAGSTFATTLKEMRERRGATQAEVAEAVRVSRATIAQWETGRHLPSSERAEALDGFLDTRGALRNLADGERRESRAEGGAEQPGRRGTNLLKVFRSVEAALDECLIRSDDGQPLGWSQNLQRRERATALSTAFGIKSVLLMDEAAKVDLGMLGRRLMDQQEPDGGWKASLQRSASPEATAIVIDALVRVDLTSDIDRLVDLLHKTVDEVAWQRPYIMATAIETVLDLRPDSEFCVRLLHGLLDARIDAHQEGGAKVWGEKHEPDLVAPDAFNHHTARSICALGRARSIGAVPEELAGQVDEAIGTAVTWLKDQSRLRRGTKVSATSESVARVTGDAIFIRHYTPPFLVRAYLLAGEPVASPSVDAALQQIWEDFDPEHSLWRWPNGDLPVWMTQEAIAALRLAALAAFHPH